MSIAVVGAVALDDIETPGGAVRGALGGSATHFALAAALRAPVHLISVVGDDLPAEAWTLLRTAGVDTTGVHVGHGPTFRWGCRYSHDWDHRATLFTEPGAFACESVRVPNAAHGAAYVMLTAGQPDQNRHALAAFSPGGYILMDSIEREIRDARAALLTLLQHVDLLTLNEGEAALLTGAPPGDAAATFAAVRALGPAIFLLKRGGRGTTICTDEAILDIPAVPDVPIVDPTGAGDAFAGGVTATLRDGASLPDAVRWGNAVASFAIEGFGVDGLRRATAPAVDERVARIRAVEAAGETASPADPARAGRGG